MKKRILFPGIIACVLIASCAQEKEGVTNDVDSAGVMADSTDRMDTSGTNTDSSARSGNLPSDPKVNINNYKHSNLSKEAQRQQDSADGKSVDVVYKTDPTSGNYKNNSNSTEVVTEKSNTTQNKVGTGNTSNGGNYKNQQK